jgi:hypothetical protein
VEKLYNYSISNVAQRRERVDEVWAISIGKSMKNDAIIDEYISFLYIMVKQTKCGFWSNLRRLGGTVILLELTK